MDEELENEGGQTNESFDSEFSELLDVEMEDKFSKENQEIKEYELKELRLELKVEIKKERNNKTKDQKKDER